MGTFPLPEVPYDATALRPAWTDLPAEVRGAITGRLGAEVVSVRVAGAGFTRGFAAVLGTAAGERAFVKASPGDFLVHAYHREALVTAALPAGVPAARPRWTATVGDWFVLCLGVIDGRLPALPWREPELAATLDAWARSAALLSTGPPPLLDLDGPDLGELLAGATVWRPVAAHRAPSPVVPRGTLAHLDELAGLEQRLIDLATGHPGLTHGDLRLDNVLIDAAGQAWLCDWNHLCHGPAWFDTAMLLVTAYASGLDATALFAGHPTAVGAPDDALDAALAGLAGIWADRADRVSDASPAVQAHQRFSSRAALAWLGERRGW